MKTKYALAVIAVLLLAGAVVFAQDSQPTAISANPSPPPER